MRILIFIISLMVFGNGKISAQDDVQIKLEQVVREGKQFYQVEMACRIAAKLFPQNYKGKGAIGGYVAVSNGQEMSVWCYSQGPKVKSLGTITFDPTLEEEKARVVYLESDLPEQASKLIALKEAARKRIDESTDIPAMNAAYITLIPVVNPTGARIMAITEADQPGVVVFGRDYMLSANAEGKITEVQPQHQHIATVNYTPGAGGKNNSISSHTHIGVKSELPTSSDIAILLLNQKETSWQQHTFIAENYIYFWDHNNLKIQAIPKKTSK